MHHCCVQVGIPVGAERVNTKTTEEVTLPPSGPHKPIIGEKISIATLDKVAKLVFSRTKRLNEVCLCKSWPCMDQFIAKNILIKQSP